MKKTAFLDMNDGELTVHIIASDRSGNKVSETFTTPFETGIPADKTSVMDGVEESLLSIPPDWLNFRLMELPLSDQAKALEVIPYELDGMILGGSQGVVFDAKALGMQDGKTKALVVYIEKEKLSGILKSLLKWGIDPKVVTSVAVSYALHNAADEASLVGMLFDSSAMTVQEREGWCLRAMESPPVNLRRGDFAYTADSAKVVKSLTVTAVLVSVLAAVFIGHMSFRIITAKKEASSLRDSLRKAYVEIFPNENKVSNELYQIKAHIKELRDKEKYLMGVSPLKVMMDVSSANNSVAIFSEINLDRERVVLKGECGSLTDVQKLKSSLEAFLGDVSITDAKPSAQNRTVFTIIAKGRKS